MCKPTTQSCSHRDASNLLVSQEPLSNLDVGTAQLHKTKKKCMCPQWETEDLASQKERRMMPFMLVQQQLLFLRL